jgi:pyrroline-5-carboxylate reductase
MQVGIVGAGNMARAIASGLETGFTITDGGSGRAAAVAEAHGGVTAIDNAELARACDVIFLCSKPAQLDAVARELAGFDGIVVSALAATPTRTIVGALPAARVVRLMPNTPVAQRAGVLVISDESDMSAVDEVLPVLKALGSVEQVPEDQMELATAVGGCAPAFFALFAQRLYESAVARGMEPGQARRIVGDTLTGTGVLAGARGHDFETLQREVASPGGLTERALRSFDENGLKSIVDTAIDAVLGKGT